MTPASAGGVRLRPFGRAHADRTFAWNNDPELARLLDRAKAIEPEEHERWCAGLSGRTDLALFAIELASGQHVGNVWLANIDPRHRKAEVRILIGEPDAVNQGVGAAAIDLVTRHAFETLGLHRVYAFVLAFNARALRAFEKAGFAVEGTLRDDRWSDDRFVDTFLLARVATHHP